LSIKNISIILLFIGSLAAGMQSDPERPRVGLVLSGGGARGMAHIGTLKLLDSLGIPVDYIAGTSMGGIIGALYAIGYSGKELENLIKQTDWNEVFTDRPDRQYVPYLLKKYDGQHQLIFGLKGFTPIMPGALIAGQKVSLYFSHLTLEYASVSDFDRLPIAFRCVAVDLVTGKEVVLKGGSLARAMRATMSIPSVFSPVQWGDSLLIDGGIVNNLPADVVREMGAEIVIGVDVGGFLKSRAELIDILDVFEQSFTLVGLEKVEQNQDLIDIFVRPALSNFAAADFSTDRIADIMAVGDLAARKQLPELISLRNQLGDNKPKNIRVADTGKQLIHGIKIFGNEQLSFGFIYNQIGLKPGDIFDETDLERRITDLYALGYFETITYDIREVDADYVSLRIDVQEKTKRELRVGLRFDDFYDLVGLASFIGTDILIPGLRLESDFMFAGLTKFNIKTSLPSRSLDLAIFPFLGYTFKDIPIAIYDEYGNRIATYKDRSSLFGAGFDILFNKSWFFEAGYGAEYLNVKPDVAIRDTSRFPTFSNNLRQIILTTTIDQLDDILVPNSGYYLNANYEGSFKKIGSDLDYYRIDAGINWYMTPVQTHTFMLGAYYANSSKLPLYKYFLLGGPGTFVGLDYFQLFAERVMVGRIDYRYQFKKDIFIRLMANAAIGYRINGQSPPERNELITGYGLGIKFLSILGPLEIIYARGDRNPLHPGEKQFNFYVVAGYKF